MRYSFFVFLEEEDLLEEEVSSSVGAGKLHPCTRHTQTDLSSDPVQATHSLNNEFQAGTTVNRDFIEI